MAKSKRFAVRSSAFHRRPQQDRVFDRDAGAVEHDDFVVGGAPGLRPATISDNSA
jgi:hypothetical protein